MSWRTSTSMRVAASPPTAGHRCACCAVTMACTQPTTCSKHINDGSDSHSPATRLVAIENTTNMGGGSCWNLADIQAIRAVCDQNDLRMHLDGARLFNALVATGESPKRFGELFDTISICLSKGLGAPVGSLLLGSDKHIAKAHRYRKSMGGGMRQAGYLAAAGSYALDNHVERLAN